LTQVARVRYPLNKVREAQVEIGLREAGRGARTRGGRRTGRVLPVEVDNPGSAIVAGVEGVNPLPEELEAGVQNVSSMRDHQSVVCLQHSGGEVLLRTDVGTPDGIHIGKTLDCRQSGSAVVGAIDAELLADIPQAIVGSA